MRIRDVWVIGVEEAVARNMLPSLTEIALYLQHQHIPLKWGINLPCHLLLFSNRTDSRQRRPHPYHYVLSFQEKQGSASRAVSQAQKALPGKVADL